MYIIKKIIKKLLALLGYQIYKMSDKRDVDHQKKSHYYTKYQESIKEMESLYKELCFNDYKISDDKRLGILSDLLGTQLSEAIYILYYLNKSLLVYGDICEFGVAQGRTSVLMANEIQETEKKIWLFDSFQGLPKPTTKDILINDIFNLGSIDAYQGTMNCKENMVKEALYDINFPDERVKIINGFIEDTIKNNDLLPKNVCFAYIDFDFYEPILIALNFLDKVMQVNCFIVVDDYNFFSSGVKTAVDEFCNLQIGKYEVILPLKSAGNFCVLKKLK